MRNKKYRAFITKDYVSEDKYVDGDSSTAQEFHKEILNVISYPSEEILRIEELNNDNTKRRVVFLLKKGFF